VSIKTPFDILVASAFWEVGHETKRY
jgi:hypothetical protein